jgi:hypothetical protein
MDAAQMAQPKTLVGPQASRRLRYRKFSYAGAMSHAGVVELEHRGLKALDKRVAMQVQRRAPLAAALSLPAF